MANTYTLIASNTLTSSAASVTFSSIPGTYTDLVLKYSARVSVGLTGLQITFQLNSDTSTNYSVTWARVNTTSVQSGRTSSANYWYPSYGYTADNATSNTFASGELYIPSYTASQNKPASFFGSAETNSTNAYIGTNAMLWRNTAAVDTIKIYDADGYNLVSGSSFFLYGVKNT